MKKIFLLLISLIHFEAISENFQMPFETVSLNHDFILEATLFTPPLVSDATFVAEVKENCRAFEALIPSTRSTLDLNYYQDLLRMPLAYMMKPNYLIYLRVPTRQVEKIHSVGQLIMNLNSQPSLKVSFAEDSFTNIGVEKFGFKPELKTELKSDGALWISITSRDVFCDFLNKKLTISLNTELNMQLNDEKQRLNHERLGEIFNELDSILKSNLKDREKSALAGFKTAIHLQRKKQIIPVEFRSVNYLWKLFFDDENTLHKTYIWPNPLSSEKIYNLGEKKAYLRGIF